jgi:hypothetical protein
MMYDGFSFDDPDRLDPKRINTTNAHTMLASVCCPLCGRYEALELFTEVNNGGTGVKCGACNTRHPLPGIMWLRREKRPRPPNNVIAVIKECGNYCHNCGIDFETLRRWGIGRHVHHTRPYAKYGDDVKKFPVCTWCHEEINATQRRLPRLVAAVSNTIVEDVRQELLRELGSWFTGKPSYEQAFKRIMQCVRAGADRCSDNQDFNQEKKDD